MCFFIVYNFKCWLVLCQFIVFVVGVVFVCVVYGEGFMVICVYVCKFIFMFDKILFKCGVFVVFELIGQDILMGFLILDFNVWVDVVLG